ncbi:MAG TPA: zf-HC2 domain-containing protein [Pirellulales bacterium]|jgi:predicted anti-sigma-YlaC factor YlaD|nr:zf-HC2 domain-containing protein [Pirellulales bacterium]
MAQESQTDRDWTACPTGTLQGLAGRLRARRRRTVALRAAGVAAAAVAILFAVRFAPKRHAADDYFHGGLYCSQVRPVLPDYRAGRLQGELLSQVEQHLAECPPCRRVLDGLKGQAASASHGHVHPLTKASQSGWRFASALR